MADRPQESGFSEREQELITNITAALRGMDRRTQANEEQEESTIIPIDRRAKEGPDFPDIFIKIIEIFEQTRNAVFRTADMEGQHDLTLETDLSLKTPELRLKLSTDKRGRIARALNIHKDQLTSKILVLTNEGYRITGLEDLEKRRFIAGGTASRLRLAQYGPNSIMPILDFLKKFHHLIQQATSQP